MVVTFVTSSSPKCVGYLDDRRCNKQRIEAYQILQTLENTSSGWRNHPAVKMWIGHTDALKVYINHCIREWRSRGKNCKLNEYDIDETSVTWPWWFTWEQLHLSHKCSLLRKNPEYYSKIFKILPPETHWLDFGYIWPHKIATEAIEFIHSNPTDYEAHEVCDVIGMGAPAQYRWTSKEVSEWSRNKTCNPKTGRSIKNTKTGIYSDLTKAQAYYKTNNLL